MWRQTYQINSFISSKGLLKQTEHTELAEMIEMTEMAELTELIVKIVFTESPKKHHLTS